MPGPYKPPQPRRSTQAVRSTRGVTAPAWRWWWLVPAVGLVPVLVVALLVQGAFGRQAVPPELTGPVAEPAATSRATAVATPTGVTGAAVATPTTSTTSSTSTSTTSAAAAASGPTAAPTSTSGATASGTTAAAAPTPSSATPATSTTAAATAGTDTAAANDSGAQPYIAYHVQRGDTLRTISNTYGVSVAVIAKASGVQNPNQLKVGQVLTIPKQPGWLYRVQDGETLDQIATRNNVTSNDIASATGLTAASVQAGDVVLIPDPSQSAAATNK